MEKKAQFTISSLGTVAIALLIAAVVLGLGATILSEVQDVQTDSVGTITEEVITWPGNNTYVYLAETRVIAGSETVYNYTDTMTSGVDYILNGSRIKFINDSGDTWNTSYINITYNYNYGSHAYNSSIEGLSGVSTMSEFVPTVAIVAVAAVVIGLILVMFGRRRY